ncbi:DUF2953 domain-containing protein [Clostridium ganghwense]|uniref:DUF2953 domain-containing protein n=1 Tax=Clostridium ganghwense TaxID=312089 RepID=A0ABT4CTE3_9CLOT|nr:DUF2953 domain-containing protein [Clostridium ganghwense]MCY6371219.1 DUF2953 domain-containing protein [Clostridium ganghwense]
MVLIWILISIFLTILILITIVPLKIIFNSDENLDFHILVTWLNPLFKASVQNKDTIIFLSVYLFNKKILSKPVKAKNKKTKKLNNKNKLYYLQQVKPYYFNIDTSYGFKDPSITGIICGIINSFAELIDLRNIRNNPNFVTENNYFNVNGIVKLHIVSTIIKLLSSYIKSHKVIYQK